MKVLFMPIFFGNRFQLVVFLGMYYFFSYIKANVIGKRIFWLDRAY